ncbi:MAG: hypothetical protein M3Y57_20910 [Acidobacteriota bacterium]|nr:hypothetical protein [Acidobacteriota bacterium]
MSCFDASLYHNPRQDVPKFPSLASPAPQPPTRPNDLLQEYVAQAAYLEKKLPSGARTGTNLADIHTDHDAQVYLQRVYAALRSVPVQLPAAGGGGL